MSTSEFSGIDKSFNQRLYPAKVIKVYDGDTITVEINLGFDVSITKSCRLIDIDALEIKGEERPEGLIAAQALRTKLLDKDVFIETSLNSHYREKICFYKRPLIKVYLNGESISQWMVDNGHAKWREASLEA